MIRMTLFLSGNAKKQTLKKLSDVVLLLEHEKQTTGKYPEKLLTIVRNNPLLKDIVLDHWRRELVYKRNVSSGRYRLYSLGKDGVSNTEDDILKE